jgi:hypothetical protein
MICGTPNPAKMLPMQRDGNRSRAEPAVRKIRFCETNFTEIHHLAWLNWQQDGCPEGFDMEYYVAAESLVMGQKRRRPAAPTRTATGGKRRGDSLDPHHTATAHARSFASSSQPPEPTADSPYPRKEPLENEQPHETA